MNKTELINKVAEKSDMSKKDATNAVEAILEGITEVLASGDSVKLQGFGNFQTRERKATTGVNPSLLKELKAQGVDAETARTQAAINIEAKRVPAFKAGKNLKDCVNV